MDRLSDFKLGTGDEIKADESAASGCLELQWVRSSFAKIKVLAKTFV